MQASKSRDISRLRQIWDSANDRKFDRKNGSGKTRNRRPVLQYAGEVWNKSKPHGGDNTPPEWFCRSESVNYGLIRRSPKGFSPKEKALSLLVRIRWTIHRISGSQIVSPAHRAICGQVTGYPVTNRQIIDDCMGPPGLMFTAVNYRQLRRRLAVASEELSTLLRTRKGTLVRRFNRPRADDGTELDEYSSVSSY